jgi:hypothetical protein
METMTSRFVYLITFVALATSGSIRAERNYSLRGEVEDQFSRSLPKALITLTSLERLLQTRAALDGSFEFTDVSANAYEIEIAAPGFAKQTSPLTSEPRTQFRRTKLSFMVGSIPDLETCGPHSVVTYGPVVESSYRLAGVIYSYDHNKPVANANVTLRPTGEDDRAFRATSDKNGKYVFENLAAARYELQVSRNGYASENVKLVVPRSNEVFVYTTILGGNRLVVCQ